MTHALATVCAVLLVAQAIAFGIMVAREHENTASERVWAVLLMVASVAGALALVSLF